MSRIKDQYLAGIVVLIIPKKRSFLGNWSQIKDSTSVFSFTDLKTIQVKRPQQAWNQNPQQNVSFSYKISGSLFFHFYFPLDKTLGSKGYNYSHIKPGYNLPIRDLLYHICNFPFISITPYSFILCAWQRRNSYQRPTATQISLNCGETWKEENWIWIFSMEADRTQPVTDLVDLWRL